MSLFWKSEVRSPKSGVGSSESEVTVDGMVSTDCFVASLLAKSFFIAYFRNDAYNEDRVLRA